MTKHNDTYRTLARPSAGFYKEKGSKFFAFAAPVSDEIEINQYLDKIKKEHHKARHHCYAWKLDFDGNLFRINDDGEPSGTAGRPIFGQLESFNITRSMVVVTRYFGGTLLGASGLIRSYKNAAANALEQAEIIESYITDRIEVEFEYGNMSSIMGVIKQFDAAITEQQFDLHPSIVIELRKSLTDDFVNNMKAQVAQISLEEAMTIDEIEHLNITIC